MPTDCDVNQKSEPIWVLLIQSVVGVISPATCRQRGSEGELDGFFTSKYNSFAATEDLIAKL